MADFYYQDYLEAQDRAKFVWDAIQNHKQTQAYKTALVADEYEAQRNVTINEYVQKVFTLGGLSFADYTATNSKIASNFFHRLNTQRCLYSLGNGVSFLQPDEDQGGGDKVKDKLGKHFDHRIKEAAYYALIHGVAFLYWNVDRVHVFKLTEFVPIYDVYNGALMAGIQFYDLGQKRGTVATLYTPEGYMEFYQDKRLDMKFMAWDDDFTVYQRATYYLAAEDKTWTEDIGNYDGALPIFPMWAGRSKQSTLVGMREAIDSYDLICSGFANDLSDVAQVYWLMKNAGGMNEADLEQFRERLKFAHIAKVDGTDGAGVEPYTQEIPYQARDNYLTLLRNSIYENFGALDVHTVAAGATNDHIDAAYQPMDENADDFEYWVGDCIERLLALLGIEDTPVFKRNRISNQLEQVQMVAIESQWLDAQTILKKLPNLDAEEVQAVLEATEAGEAARLGLELAPAQAVEE